MARPLKEINWTKVERQMEAGLTAKQIAASLRVDLDTFYRRFKKQFGSSFGDYADEYSLCGEGELKFAQYMKALSGNIQMLIWLGKVRLGQREPDMLTLTPIHQEEINKDHRIMELEHRLATIEENGHKPETEQELL